eukprot:scaffold38709_cov56-Phaeocystis_antarctica.AAC.3
MPTAAAARPVSRLMHAEQKQQQCGHEEGCAAALQPPHQRAGRRRRDSKSASASRARTTSKLNLVSTKLRSPLRELSNAVSIVSWVPGGGNLPDSRVDQRVPAPELSRVDRNLRRAGGGEGGQRSARLSLSVPRSGRRVGERASSTAGYHGGSSFRRCVEAVVLTAG